LEHRLAESADFERQESEKEGFAFVWVTSDYLERSATRIPQFCTFGQAMVQPTDRDFSLRWNQKSYGCSAAKRWFKNGHWFVQVTGLVEGEQINSLVQSRYFGFAAREAFLLKFYQAPCARESCVELDGLDAGARGKLQDRKTGDSPWILSLVSKRERNFQAESPTTPQPSAELTLRRTGR